MDFRKASSVWSDKKYSSSVPSVTAAKGIDRRAKDRLLGFTDVGAARLEANILEWLTLCHFDLLTVIVAERQMAEGPPPDAVRLRMARHTAIWTSFVSGSGWICN
jgi:hypothetical protein